MTFIVALTGGIGSGKSEVSNAFAQLGTPIVDADVIARQVVLPNSPALTAIANYFGADFILPNGQLNRPALREHIFSHPEDKTWLNQLLHPLIQQETQRQLRAVNVPYVLWVVPLLIENNLSSLADRVLVIDVSRDIQLSRTMLRDKVDRQQAENILAAQVSREVRLSHADDIMDNNGTQAELAAQVLTLHKRYLALASSDSQQDKK